MAPRSNGNAPLTTNELIGKLTREICPGCAFTKGGLVNALQCQVIHNLRQQVIDPASVLDNPCQKVLICTPGACSAGTNGDCQAEEALESLTDPKKAAGIFTKAAAGAILHNIPVNCPRGFNGML